MSRSTSLLWLSMLQWFRASGRLVAAVVLAAFVSLGGVESTTHRSDCHDESCAVVRHDPTGHGLQAPAAAAGSPLHCVLCHWTRSTRQLPDLVYALVPLQSADTSVLPVARGAVSGAVTPQPPLRSPPTASAPLA